jgi:hypothetical protein
MKKYKDGGIFRAGMQLPDNKDGMPGTEKKRPKNTAGSKVAVKPKTYAKGGSIDGCAVKGKTKGTMVKMAKGGKTC